MELFAWIIAIYIWLFANPLISMLIYVIPLVIALIRHHNSVVMLVILNVLFGWIFLLWIILILWAMFGDNENDEPQSVSP
ncbi:superinfection immunity protein [Salmonella enterica]|nr:superinfection immunity protein [Salmonella enterica]EJO1930443.1 superinfection immunity protein [Salmonella enterica]